MSYEPLTVDPVAQTTQRLQHLERIFVQTEANPGPGKMPPHLYDEMLEVRKVVEAAEAQRQSQDDQDFAQALAAAIESTEGKNEDPATILTAIESLRDTPNP